MLRAVFILLLGVASGSLVAADLADASVKPEDRSTSAIAQSDLQKLQVRLDTLKQQVSDTTNYTQLVGYQDKVQQLVSDANQLAVLLLPQQAQLQARLEVLGPPPTDSATLEKPDIAQQRSDLIRRKSEMDADLKLLEGLKQNAANLTLQIAGIRRRQLETQLVLRTGSLLGSQFWSPLFHPLAEDKQRLKVFIEQATPVMQAIWQPGQRGMSAALLLLALGVWTLGRNLAERGLTWLCIHRLPEGRLRRSSLAITTTLATVLTAGCALQLVYFALARQYEWTPMLQNFADELEKLVYTCAMITGLSRALLSTRHPSWRLPDISDPVALAIKPFPRILAGLLLVLVFLVQMSNTAGMSTQVISFGRGVVALIVALVIGALLVRVNHVRRALAIAGEPPEARSTFAGLLYAGAYLVIVLSLFSLVIGYTTLARFLTYELVWIYIVVASFYLLTQLLRDTCDNVFSPRQPSGKAIKQLLGLSDVRLEQTAIVLSGVGRALLLLLAVIALFVGGLGSTLGQLVNSTFAVLGGDGLRKLNIIPAHLLNAVLALAIGVYLVRTLHRWLDRELMPKTDMDPGMCASLSTLFGNVSYAVVILLALSSLGIKWTSLAWIVSALSVGIGFGLQEIVKNFVSGIILLTERPVKVGDLVSISGVEGDIRRINVRATEIQLSDRSIVIVPNSQLISQNLRNVTMGGSAQGVATLELTLPLDIDPELVRNLLLEAYGENESILDKPAPSVRFSQLTPDGITLTITGYVSSPRIVSTTKSDLLFEILKRLSAAGIALASPKPR
jgi:small-conductance mechanosensitive channel